MCDGYFGEYFGNKKQVRIRKLHVRACCVSAQCAPCNLLLLTVLCTVPEQLPMPLPALANSHIIVDKFRAIVTVTKWEFAMAVIKDLNTTNNIRKLNGNFANIFHSNNNSFNSFDSFTMSTDSEDMDPLQYELRNIQNVIHFTRQNIDALNAKFADFQHPPPMYLSEYQELTSKLHEFEVEEHKLMEQISNGRDSPEETISLHSECDSVRPSK